eukprot:PhM_4_TR16753/c0_g1_i6/m.66745
MMGNDQPNKTPHRRVPCRRVRSLPPHTAPTLRPRHPPYYNILHIAFIAQILIILLTVLPSISTVDAVRRTTRSIDNTTYNRTYTTTDLLPLTYSHTTPTWVTLGSAVSVRLQPIPINVALVLTLRPAASAHLGLSNISVAFAESTFSLRFNATAALGFVPGTHYILEVRDINGNAHAVTSPNRLRVEGTLSVYGVPPSGTAPYGTTLSLHVILHDADSVVLRHVNHTVSVWLRDAAPSPATTVFSAHTRPHNVASLRVPATASLGSTTWYRVSVSGGSGAYVHAFADFALTTTATLSFTSVPANVYLQYPFTVTVDTNTPALSSGLVLSMKASVPGLSTSVATWQSSRVDGSKFVFDNILIPLSVLPSTCVYACALIFQTASGAAVASIAYTSRLSDPDIARVDVLPEINDAANPFYAQVFKLSVTLSTSLASPAGSVDGVYGWLVRISISSEPEAKLSLTSGHTVAPTSGVATFSNMAITVGAGSNWVPSGGLYFTAELIRGANTPPRPEYNTSLSTRSPVLTCTPGSLNQCSQQITKLIIDTTRFTSRSFPTGVAFVVPVLHVRQSDNVVLSSVVLDNVYLVSKPAMSMSVPLVRTSNGTAEVRVTVHGAYQGLVLCVATKNIIVQQTACTDAIDILDTLTYTHSTSPPYLLFNDIVFTYIGAGYSYRAGNDELYVVSHVDNCTAAAASQSQIAGVTVVSALSENTGVGGGAKATLRFTTPWTAYFCFRRGDRYDVLQPALEFFSKAVRSFGATPRSGTSLVVGVDVDVVVEGYGFGATDTAFFTDSALDCAISTPAGMSDIVTSFRNFDASSTKFSVVFWRAAQNMFLCYRHTGSVWSKSTVTISVLVNPSNVFTSPTVTFAQQNAYLLLTGAGLHPTNGTARIVNTSTLCSSTAEPLPGTPLSLPLIADSPQQLRYPFNMPNNVKFKVCYILAASRAVWTEVGTVQIHRGNAHFQDPLPNVADGRTSLSVGAAVRDSASMQTLTGLSDGLGVSLSVATAGSHGTTFYRNTVVPSGGVVAFGVPLTQRVGLYDASTMRPADVGYIFTVSANVSSVDAATHSVDASGLTQAVLTTHSTVVFVATSTEWVVSLLPATTPVASRASAARVTGTPCTVTLLARTTDDSGGSSGSSGAALVLNVSAAVDPLTGMARVPFAVHTLGTLNVTVTTNLTSVLDSSVLVSTASTLEIVQTPPTSVIVGIPVLLQARLNPAPSHAVELTLELRDALRAWTFTSPSLLVVPSGGVVLVNATLLGDAQSVTLAPHAATLALRVSRNTTLRVDERVFRVTVSDPSPQITRFLLPSRTFDRTRFNMTCVIADYWSNPVPLVNS